MAIHHLQIWVPDLGRAERSWGWLLDELGFVLTRTWVHGRVWRKHGTGIVIEQSPDMVPGMLHSRLRPGMNHVAFHVDDAASLEALVAAAPGHGWTSLEGDRHPLPSGSTTAYIEDADGFEVELVAPEAASG
ncbi:glyoxalase [Iamia sp. SCSIO 61187]|uniref:VOC family protein n=1 Tax=Iamia sp. SCSIO 61187 TaxID=2722752 RepID=UPI001C62E323|nr:VOC family protein [Iamia sp. SCSIO 61187]QYG94990.1 glyoxalase [Iamia sp. SCSIO 61187]